ncbi:transmembrane protein 53-A-like isoform X2 [Conger conger]|uniref:transmembrane protein 53-A-like isoform X2 n=2 Tax=Conger conger TaxID=82655 RepID=UPI002A5ADC63|nr:transmembrane protein 53-A-like isoform X2 [Conger conger]
MLTHSLKKVWLAYDLRTLGAAVSMVPMPAKVWLAGGLRALGTAVSMSPIPATVAGVTAHKISKKVTLYVNDSPAARVPLQGGGDRPLLLLFPWLGSRPQALSKYCEMYFRVGLDVLIVESELSQFLWPRWGQEYGAQVLDLLHEDRFVTRPLMVHAFSIGGYMIAQMLMLMARDPERYRGLMERVQGQVYDSLVDGSLERIAVGLGKSMFPNFEGLVTWLSLLYFRVSKKHTLDLLHGAVEKFWDNPITAPSLFFYSEDDPLCDYRQLEELMELWQKRGTPVQSRKWIRSLHAGHLRQHPQEYLSTLEHFLCSLNLIPPKAKM